jgi:hypothetical protein
MALATTANTAIVPSQLFISALCQVKEEKYRNQPSFLLPPASQKQTEKTCACVICIHPLYPTQNNVIFRKLMCKPCLVQVSPTLRRHVA